MFNKTRSWNDESTLAEILEIAKSIPGARPEPRTPSIRFPGDKFELPLRDTIIVHTDDKFELPLRDTIIVHTDDLASIPDVVIEGFRRAGLPVHASPFTVRGVFVVMGRAAEAFNRMKFEQDVQQAMRENARFLEIMRNSGLI